MTALVASEDGRWHQPCNDAESRSVIAPVVAVVIPAFRVATLVLGVIREIGPEVQRIYVIDDACPEGSGALVEAQCADPRVKVLKRPANGGVGAAVMTGYQAALNDGVDIIVKLDGDGQMDAQLISNFIDPIAAGRADYTKGNRFYNLEGLEQMPSARLIGNAALSLMNKVSSGYWDIFDPTNGYTAIHANVARDLPLAKISARYFFETDMLFRLNLMRAVVWDVPMKARYGAEVSNLRIRSVVGEFLMKHLRNTFKRIFYNYYLRDVSIASIELVLGSALLAGGSAFGAFQWLHSAHLGITTSAGAVMLASLPILTGLQLLLAFVNYDIGTVPRRPLHVTMNASRRSH
jgi:dolichol-phosphate mannosyltransferase